ncbi:MAG: Bicyclomycin resistance protein [Alphaproteobacteria bacterium MarineAlpha11_Bin1]|nr:MAG: Bicyclomycin resistance protein [Alphaproteobacteria bacterium MarineAlpha11_Bin1]|tara:strand:- start:2756 stop:3946 length:1191 start_codon:yes stop_codon:yes gene_type:complete
MKTFDNAGFAALLALTTVMSAAGIDGILPLMPMIGSALNGDRESVQLTLTMFMLGIAVGQLIHGPISDRFGRKPAIVGGLIITSAATAGCALSSSIEMLIAFRFVHGLAASSGWLVARAIIRDRHEYQDAARVMSLMMVFHSTAPMLAPIIGAALTVYIGWEAMFIFLSVYSLSVAIFFSVFFKETIAAKAVDALNPGPIFRNFWKIANTGSFWAYTGCATAAYGMLFAFLSASADVIISHLGQSELHYSYMFAGVMVGSVCGMLMGARLVAKYGGDRLLYCGVLLAATFSLVLAGLAWARVDHWFSVMGPMAFCMVAFALIFPQSIAGVLQPFSDIAGAASSLVGFIQQLMGALTGVLVAVLSDGTQVSMAIGVLFWAIFGFLTYFAAVRNYRII